MINLLMKLNKKLKNMKMNFIKIKIFLTIQKKKINKMEMNIIN